MHVICDLWERGCRHMRWSSKLTPKLNAEQLAILLTATGILIRVVLYGANKPFWTDEAQLALNLRARSLVELFGPLDYCQSAPPGFLLIEKILLVAFGDEEYVYRLFPFIAGVGSQVLFWRLAKCILSKEAVPLAVGLFAFSEPLIRYSCELKQYSLDVLCGVILLYTGLKAITALDGRHRLTLLGIAGLITPWFSYSSAMLMAANSLMALVAFLNAKLWKRVLIVILISALWLASCYAVYSLTLQHLLSNPAREALLDVRSAIPHDASCILWLLRKLYEVLEDPGGFCCMGTGISLICVICGSKCLQTFPGAKCATFTLLCLPLLFVISGSWLHIYPLLGRFLLFLVPGFLLLVAEGASCLFQIISLQSKPIAVLTLALLFIPRFELLRISESTITLRRTEIREVLRYIAAKRSRLDLIYVYYGAYFPVLYYCNKFGFKEKDLITGVPGYWWNRELRKTLLDAWLRSHAGSIPPGDDTYISYTDGNCLRQWSYFERDIKLLQGNQRVWIIFSQTVWLGRDEKPVYLSFLDKAGRRLDQFTQPRASVFLYDLSK